MIRLAIMLLALAAVAHADPARCIAPAAASGDFHERSTPLSTLQVGCAGSSDECKHYHDHDDDKPRQPDRQWFELAGNRLILHYRRWDRVATLALEFNVVRCFDEKTPIYVADHATLHDADGTTRTLDETSVELNRNGALSIRNRRNSDGAAGAMGCREGCISDHLTWTGERTFANGKPLDPAAAARAEADRKRREAADAADEARREADAARAGAAHLQQLQKAFPPRASTKKPVTPEVRREKAKCLSGDAAACGAVQPMLPDPYLTCRTRVDAELRACAVQAAPCKDKCNAAELDCTLREILEACATDFRSDACRKHSGCSTLPPCNCPDCRKLDSDCGLPPARPSRTTAQ